MFNFIWLIAGGGVNAGRRLICISTIQNRVMILVDRILLLISTRLKKLLVQFISTRLKKFPISSNNRELEAPELTILHKPSK